MGEKKWSKYYNVQGRVQVGWDMEINNTYKWWKNILCWVQQEEKYWDKCYNVQEWHRGSEIDVEKNDG